MLPRQRPFGSSRGPSGKAWRSRFSMASKSNLGSLAAAAAGALASPVAAAPAGSRRSDGSRSGVEAAAAALAPEDVAGGFADDPTGAHCNVARQSNEQQAALARRRVDRSRRWRIMGSGLARSDART